jgi:hypothetical protein
VREAARRAMVTLMPLMPASALLQVVPTVLELVRMTRTDHSQWQVRFEALLLQTLSAEDFVEGIKSGDRRVARACFTILDRHRLIAPDRLAALGMATGDDIVLAQQALECIEQLPAEDQYAFHRIAVRSHFGVIRARALRFVLARAAGESRTAMAMDALFDQHWSVRAVAATSLRAFGFDLQAYYRAVLLNSSARTAHLQIALTGLAGVNDAMDLALVRGFIDARIPAVRRTALAAWLALKPADKDLIAIEALRDSSAAVRRFAGNVILRKGAYVPFDVIRSHLERQGDWSMLLSLAQMQKWEWLETIVRAACASVRNEFDIDRVRSSLRSWRLRAVSRYETPTARQVEFLRSAPAQLALCQLIGDPTMPVPFIELELRGL